MGKNPILPLYYNDLLGSTQDWTDEEFGAYMRLLIYQWDKGFIPNEMKRLLKIADSAEKNWPVLCQKFTPGEQGFLKNSVMEKIRFKRENFLKHQTENGIQGGRPPKTQTQTQLKTQTKAKKKPLESEKENEIEKEFEEEIIMPFKSENFLKSWLNWKKYRYQEFKRKYKSAQSEQQALTHLQKISNGIEEAALAVIAQSEANQWQGLFEIKNNLNGSDKPVKTGTSAARIETARGW